MGKVACYMALSENIKISNAHKCLFVTLFLLHLSQVMLVTPLVPLGALLDYVRRHRTNISSKALLNWSTQIAKVCFCLLLLGPVTSGVPVITVVILYRFVTVKC